MSEAIQGLNNDLLKTPGLLTRLLSGGADIDAVSSRAREMGYDVSEGQIAQYVREHSTRQSDDDELAGMMWCTNTLTKKAPAHPPAANQSLGTTWAVADVVVFAEIAVAVVAVAAAVVWMLGETATPSN